MMTRKHYELVASRLKDAGHDARTQDRMTADNTGRAGEIVQDIAMALAADFKQDNPAFDAGRFLKACGVSA